MSSIIETSPMNTPVHIENDNEEMISIDLSEVERRRELDEEAFRHIIEETRSIADRADKYKNAHTYCKGFNQISDKMVKVSMLVLSTLTTYFISKHTDELTADELFVDKNLTFGTTIVSGINAIFNFSNRAETHKAITAEYLKLNNDIVTQLNTFDYNEHNRKELNIIYKKAQAEITNLNVRSTEIGLLSLSKRKFHI